jgi:hypothetical protein
LYLLPPSASKGYRSNPLRVYPPLADSNGNSGIPAAAPAANFLPQSRIEPKVRSEELTTNHTKRTNLAQNLINTRNPGGIRAIDAKVCGVGVVCG